LNFGLFLTSNTGTGATVDAFIDLGNGLIIKLPVQDFGLINSVEDMWEAGVYPLSFLIMLFSGIWPYAKVVVMMVVFFLPCSILKPKFRLLILRILDALGKWSLLDSYVMVLMLVAFYFNVPMEIRHTNIIKEPVTINYDDVICYNVLIPQDYMKFADFIKIIFSIDDALFVGSDSQAQAILRTSHDNDKIYFLVYFIKPYI